MATEVFANVPSTTVTSGGTGAPSGGTVETWTVASSAEFAAIGSGLTQQFHVGDPEATSEIILVTAITGTTWTVTRGAESTTPVTHAAGFTIEQVITAGFLNGLGFVNPMSALGDMIYGTNGGTAARLAGNATSAREFLVSAASAGSASPPSWGTLTAADIPVLNQNTTGTAANVTGIIAIVNGGSGTTTAIGAFNAVSPMTTLGDIEYENAAPSGTRLAGNTSTQRQFLSQAGNGTISAAPAWSVVSGQIIGGPTSYAPATAGTFVITSNVMTAVSSGTINTGAFIAPPSGSVIVGASLVGGINANAGFAFGLCGHGSASPMLCPNIVFDQSSASLNPGPYNLEFLVGSLVAGGTYTFDLMGCVTSGDTLSVICNGGSGTAPTLTAAGRGAPVIMTVQAV